MDPITKQAPPSSQQDLSADSLMNPYEEEVLTGLKTSLLVYDGMLKVVARPKVNVGSFSQQLKTALQQDGYQVLYFGIAPKSAARMTNNIRICLQLDKSASFTRALTQYLLNRPRQEKKLTIIFNQAELLDHATFLCIRMLSNIQDNTQGLLNIIICGNEALNHALASPSLQSVAQYINQSFILYPWLEVESFQPFEADTDKGNKMSWPRVAVACSILLVVGSAIFIPRTLIGDTIKEFVLKPKPGVEDVQEQQTKLLSTTTNYPPAEIATNQNNRQTLAPQQPSVQALNHSQSAEHIPQTKPVETELLDQELSNMLKLWLSDWQEQNIEGYFSHYTDSFFPPEFSSNADWQEIRRERILTPQSIFISVDQVSITDTQHDTATVNFWMSYKTPTYTDNTLKELHLVQINQKWLITDETNLQITASTQ